MDTVLVKLALFLPSVVLLCVMEVEGKYCIIIDNGQTKHFLCGPFQHCCGASCCENFGPFYRLWYFWLCVMLALIFCSFGGYWYRRHYFQHRLLASQSASTHSTMMMFMMNNIQTNNHYDYGGSEFYYPARCLRPQGHGFARPHQTTSVSGSTSHSAAGHSLPSGVSYQPPPTTLSTPPPSYYETVSMPPPPDYTLFNNQVGGCDQLTQRSEDVARRTCSRES